MSYCHFHDCAQMMISSVYGSGWLVENNYFARNNSSTPIPDDPQQEHATNNEHIKKTTIVVVTSNFDRIHANWHIYSKVIVAKLCFIQMVLVLVDIELAKQRKTS